MSASTRLPASAFRQLVIERRLLVDSFEREIATRRRHADASRAAQWPAAKDLRRWQRHTAARLTAALGWPLGSGVKPKTRTRWRRLGDDALGEIHLVRFGVTGDYAAFALLFLPRNATAGSLVVAQHGGLGLVETIAGLHGSSGNYNDLVTRLRRRHCAVLVPQLPMWRDFAEPHFVLEQAEPRLRLLGGSYAGLQVLTLRRALDAALARPGLRDLPVGVAGLSYGGCFGLYWTALDSRVQALLSSGFFNDRHAYPQPASFPDGAARNFLDAELGALVCPRPLWIEVATRDELFKTAGAKAEAAKLRRLYRATGHAARFRYVEFDGRHEFNRDDAGLEFLLRQLEPRRPRRD